MHVSMFSAGHSKREVRAALIQHKGRDERIVNGTDIVLVLCVLFLARHQPFLDEVAIFIALIAALGGLRYFIDNAIRNFFLHRLDWEDASDWED